MKQAEVRAAMVVWTKIGASWARVLVLRPKGQDNWVVRRCSANGVAEISSGREMLRSARELRDRPIK